MRRLLPDRSAEVDLIEAFEQARSGSVRLGMVMSVDGSVTDEEGWSGKLGGAADRRVLRALRATAGVILVGAGSVRTRRYPPHRPTAEIRERRRRAGRAEVAPLVVVTGSGDLDWSLPVFTEAHTPTYVLTSARSPLEVPPHVRLLAHGEETLDLRAALADLEELFGAVLCEGGPGLATALFAEGLVDELVLSIAPSILPGRNARLVKDLASRQELALTEIYEEDGEVFLRYGVNR